jgi:hypothetical protein
MSFIRHVKLTAEGGGGKLVLNEDGRDPKQMKIEFSIAKTTSSTQNTGNIKIWNLSEAHRNAIGKELDDITLEAGYLDENNVGVIFKGQMRDVEHSRDDANIITEISCGDGDKALRKATTAKTYKKGAKVKDVVEDIYKDLKKEGITKGEFKFPDDMNNKTFKRPYTTCGSCKREADTLGRGHGFYWSIQNGTMEVIPSDGYIGTVVVISKETGMVGVPTVTDNGVKVKALLNPEIRPNRRVKIISEVLEMNAKDSEYRVSGCTFSGDNWDGNDFVVEITGESLKGKKKVDEGVKPKDKKGKK